MISFRRDSVAVAAYVLISGVLFLWWGSSPVLAQEWHPPEPPEGDKDWVQLVSGEWLHGSIDLLRDLEMEFDSDELDNLVIEWEDVAAFRTPRQMTFVFTDERVASGTGSMRDGAVRVNTESGREEFGREELLSIIEGRERERNFWSAKASIGINVRSGNTEQIDTNALVKIKREAVRTRLGLDYQGNFSDISGEETANNHMGSVAMDLFVSRRFFVTLAALELYADKFQNIEHRTTLGAGLGYYIYRQSKIEWSIGVGGGYQVTQFLSVEEGQDQRLSTGTVIPHTSLEADITSDLELDFDYRSNIGVPDTESSTHHATGLLTFDFYKDIFELSFSLTWDRVDNPKAYADGTVPENDDFRMAFGFGVDM